LYLHQFAAATIEASHGRHITVDTAYPRDGSVRITVDAAPSSPWALRVRIPHWADGSFSLSLNGRALETRPVDGYIELHRTWCEGDVLEIELPMDPRLTHAADSIEVLTGKVALERGPLVYGVEGVDVASGEGLEGLVLLSGSEPKEGPELVAGMPSLCLRAETRQEQPSDWPYGDARPPRSEAPGEDEIAAVPYFAWGNRGVGPMRVWLPVS